MKTNLNLQNYNFGNYRSHYQQLQHNLHETAFCMSNIESKFHIVCCLNMALHKPNNRCRPCFYSLHYNFSCIVSFSLKLSSLSPWFSFYLLMPVAILQVSSFCFVVSLIHSLQAYLLRLQMTISSDIYDDFRCTL